jgi:hypothetical protein
MDQLGHPDPHFTMHACSHAMRLSDDERAGVRTFVEGVEWAAPVGTTGAGFSA